MGGVKYRWTIAPPQPARAAELAARLGIAPLVAQCLLNREIGEPAQVALFLEPRLKHLADPGLLPNMAAAVERLVWARDRQEPLAIFGDYDVDGVTSTALLVEVLRALGWRVEWYLPNRMDEGYGLSQEAIENCLKRFAPSLLLAVDCGSTARSTIAWLKERGVDVIVLDHHQVSDPPPDARALVNPRLASTSPGGKAPFTELCSAGLAFKLAHALVKHGRQAGWPAAGAFDLRPLLDLVALGTVADVVPLTGENRILVAAGLQRLETTTRPGLVALKEVARSSAPLGVHEVGFQLAPRLNAAGRLETAEAALRLLQTPTLALAHPLARQLDAQNRERQEIERRIFDEALAAVRSRFNPDRDFVIVEGRESWHLGVVGIVASRILRQFYRPTIIVGGDAGAWRGSGRSIEGFDLAASLRQCEDLLLRHGGHAMAAGLALEPSKLESFRTRLNELARQALRKESLQPSLRLDAEVGLADLTLASLEELDRLKPVGHGNPPVQFCARNLRLARPPVRLGADKQHAKLWVTDGPTTQEAVWWAVGNRLLPEDAFDLAFAPQVNHYHGRLSVQLKVIEWRQSAAA